MSNKSVIIDGVRSPIGSKNGEMIGMRPDDIAAQVVKGLLERNKEIKNEEVEDVVIGCAFPEGPQGMLIGRSVAILAGLPVSTAGKVVNRFCGSSMDAMHQISTAIESGDIDVGIAAGVEDMFSVPQGGFAPDFHPELAEQEYYIGMGEGAEILAEKGNISREDQEEFAINSHKKSLVAIADGKFDNELVPVDPSQPYDITGAIEEVLDDGAFLEVQAGYAGNIVVGFGRLGGQVIGIVGNQPSVLAGCLDIDASIKGARFVRFCDAFNIPLLSLIHI